MCTFLDNPEFFLLLSFHSPATCRASLTLALRDCPRWIIANVSRERGDTSEMLSPAPSAYAECSSWIFPERRRWKISRTNDKSPICEGARREVCTEKEKKKRKGRRMRRAWERGARYGDSSGFLLPASRRDIGPRPSDIPRELPRGIPSRGSALETSTVGWLRETVISVVLRSVEELWKSPRETPCLEHVSDEMIARPRLSSSLVAPSRCSRFHQGCHHLFMFLWEEPRKLKTWAQRSRISLSAVLYATCAEESESRYQPFGATDDRYKEGCKNVKNIKYFIN